MKYVLVTGGVVSGLGKGVTASSIGVLLQAVGLRVTSIKIDPYLNTDAGTMSPFEHGEVFVLDDGGEVDLDLGTYERFLDVNLTKDNNMTTGKIYNTVIERERRGDYLGKTVQVVPHITDTIQEWIHNVAHTPVDGRDEPPDVCVIELGGTVGDIESAPFVEALQQLQFRAGPSNCCLVHVSLVPVLGVVGEQKTKPTQSTVQTLRSLGLVPNLLVCRSALPLTTAARDKISSFCHIPPANVLTIPDCSNIWHVPLLLKDQMADDCVIRQLGIDPSSYNGGAHKLDFYKRLAAGLDTMRNTVTIAVVGKYTSMSDAYLSVTKALQHACFAADVKLDTTWINASELEDPANVAWKRLERADGILIPGGFGERGVEGKIAAAKFARTMQKPFLGICLGMQIAVVEFCRNVLGMNNAHSSEFDSETPHPVVIFMPEGSNTHMGGTMRLGARRTVLQTTECAVAKLYQPALFVDERHRHRYEVNPRYVDQIEEAGMRFVGKDESGRRMEIVELSHHPYFVATQFHPEFKSRPDRPAPCFLGLVMAAVRALPSEKN